MDPTFHDYQSRVEDWHWWYAVRREILDQKLATLGLDRERAMLLDVGCGTGGASLVLSQYGRAVGLDRSLESFRLSSDRPYTHRVQAAADEPLPFADGTFDVVCALDVLEHLDDDLAAAREIHRVLKPGGTAIVFVPAFNVLWGENDDYSHHRRRYRKGEISACLAGAGFSVEEEGYFNFMLFFPMLAARLAQRILPKKISHDMEHSDRPGAFNGMLRQIFRLELPVMKRSKSGLPLGTSAFCVARRA